MFASTFFVFTNFYYFNIKALCQLDTFSYNPIFDLGSTIQKLEIFRMQNEKAIMDKLYSQNLRLGNRINSLADENNFYKIQINNFNKLTNSINKDLYKLGINFQNKGIIEDSAKVGPLFTISNKIKLKNLQLKIGNSIRNTEKFKKNLQGSLPFISKQAENLQRQISILLAKYLQMKQQNKLLADISYGQTVGNIYKQFMDAEIDNKQNEISIDQLENNKKQTVKKLEFAKKEQKQKNRTLSELVAANCLLEEQISHLKWAHPESSQMNHIRAQQAKQLQILQQEQKILISEIAIKSKQLQQQYVVNKECQQRISDKKYQESKQIKVLKQQVTKCRQQVREFKQKYQKIKVGGFRTKESR